MVGFLADVSLRHAIVTGCVRREPAIVLLFAPTAKLLRASVGCHSHSDRLRLRQGVLRPLLEVDMVARGRVRNGVVVLDNGVRLPEGQEVMVLAPATRRQEARAHGILEILPVSVGAVRPFTADDDLLGDMLEGRS